MKREQGYDCLIKLLIIGNSGVGKTNLLIRFTENNFLNSHLTTIGTPLPTQASTSRPRSSIWATPESNFRSGTPPGKNASRPSPRPTIEGLWASSSPTLSTTAPASTTSKTG